jgi:feruloyl esterase
MSEAQRYPEDYNGIVAGSGAFNRVPTHEKIIWMYQTNQFLAPPKDFTRDPDHYITPGPLPDFGKWALITNAVITACDGLDGVLDGIIDDPRQCEFDANTLLCPAATDSPTCLTPGEVWSINHLWRGTFNPRTGEMIVSGMTKGSESDPSPYRGITGIYFYPLAFEGPPPGQPQIPLTPENDYSHPSGAGGGGELLNWAPSLKNFDLRYFDWDHDAAIVDRELAPILNATNPDLHAFKAHGGKLIMFHGWADPLVYSVESPNYYENVLETMGGLNKVKGFARLFMVPGMGHCGFGGPFPAVFADSLSGNNVTYGLGSLVNWVENGKAPDQIIVLNPFIPAPGMTRPLCPYPEVARYSGSGSTNDAANFLCVPPVEIRIEPETINLKSKGVLTAFITVPAGFDVRDWGISNLECQGAPMTRGSVSYDGRTYIAKFSIQDLTNTAVGKEVTFKVEGLFEKGGKQALLLGFDVVRVIK